MFCFPQKYPFIIEDIVINGIVSETHIIGKYSLDSLNSISEINLEFIVMKIIMIKFICYPKCTTCQRAKKWLDDNKIDYELRDIKLDNPTLEELTEWYNKSGLPIKKFFNTSGLLYKSLDLKNKLPEMTEDEMLKLLATDGMLVKRPLLIGDDFVLVGFKEAEWEKLR